MKRNMASAIAFLVIVSGMFFVVFVPVIREPVNNVLLGWITSQTESISYHFFHFGTDLLATSKVICP